MPPPFLSQNLVQRIAVAAVAIPLVVGIIWLGGWVLAATLAVLGILGAREIYDFARRQGVEPLERTGWLAAGAIPLLAYWAKGSETRFAEPALYLGAIWLMVALGIAMARRGPAGRPLASVAITLFGSLYASAMLAFLIAIRHGTNAANRPRAYVLLAVFPLVITWICDTAAMAVGTRVGGPRLAPVLSPNKTHAGAVGGTLGGIIVALALGKFVLNREGWHFTDGQLLLFGLAVSIVAQVGDVAESLFKREAGLKDSSTLIPGHGGRILEAGFPLEQRYRDVTDLRDNRHGEAEQEQLAIGEMPSLTIEHKLAERECHDDAAQRPADCAGVGLVRGQHRRQPGPADPRAYRHRCRIANPGDHEGKHREEHVGTRSVRCIGAVADRDQKRQHRRRVQGAEQRDRDARQWPAGGSAPRHRNPERHHQPDRAQIERRLREPRLRAFGPVGEQRDRARGEPAGALEWLDPLAAGKIIDLARAEDAEHGERRGEYPAAHPDDAHGQRNGDRRHRDALHQVLGEEGGRHQDAVTLPNRRSRR